jgi:hypothetical protein
MGMKCENVKKMNISEIARVLIELNIEISQQHFPSRQRICWQFPKSVPKYYQNELLDKAVVLKQKMSDWTDRIRTAIDQPDLSKVNRAYEIDFYERIKRVIDGTGVEGGVMAIYNEIDNRIKQLKKRKLRLCIHCKKENGSVNTLLCKGCWNKYPHPHYRPKSKEYKID